MTGCLEKLETSLSKYNSINHKLHGKSPCLLVYLSVSQCPLPTPFLFEEERMGGTGTETETERGDSECPRGVAKSTEYGQLDYTAPPPRICMHLICTIGKGHENRSTGCSCEYHIPTGLVIESPCSRGVGRPKGECGGCTYGLSSSMNDCKTKSCQAQVSATAYQLISPSHFILSRVRRLRRVP